MQLFGQKIFKPDNTESTNRLAMHLIEQENADNGLAIITDHQTAGIGYGSNLWESEPNKNLTVSYIYKPFQVPATAQFFLNKAVSLSLYDLISDLCPNQVVKIKWPNDVYVGEKKIAGILINNIISGHYISYSILGIGLNINQEKFGSRIPNPTSLKILNGIEYKVDEIFNSLCIALNKRFNSFIMNDYEKIDSDYLYNLFRMKESNYFLINDEKVEARIIDVDEYGRLILENDGINKVFAFKEVEYVI